MKATMLTDGQATRPLIRLIRERIRFDAAVAWAGPNTAVDAMLEAHLKFGCVVIGTHMYQIDPSVLRRFMPHTDMSLLFGGYGYAQGSQFGSDDFARWCKEHNPVPCMSRRGNCYNNAVAEFFLLLKKGTRETENIFN